MMVVRFSNLISMKNLSNRHAEDRNDYAVDTDADDNDEEDDI